MRLYVTHSIFDRGGIVFVVLFLSACSTTTNIPSSIVSEWRNPAYPQGPLPINDEAEDVELF